MCTVPDRDSADEHAGYRGDDGESLDCVVCGVNHFVGWNSGRRVGAGVVGGEAGRLPQFVNQVGEQVRG